MSEQEKNTTPAQNAAPAAPKPPKIDNAALKKAAAALREENNPQNFNAVINLMMRGVFLAPAKIEIGENAPKTGRKWTNPAAKRHQGDLCAAEIW